MALYIKNARIVDGNNTPAYLGDIKINGNIIEQIGRLIPDQQDNVIDAKGLVASPGFIDTHSHSDLNVLIEPMLCPKVMQGITTEVLGQDGISMAPLPKKFIEPWRKNLAGLDGESDKINWEYETTREYLKMIEIARPSINEAYLLPHGNIRMEAIGLSDHKPNQMEQNKMCEILRREMEAGCIGLSSGLIYMPCAYSNTEELIGLCKVVKEYDGVFVVHQRSEADNILDSMKEIIRIGKESGVRIHFSHFKVCGKNNWDKLDNMLALLDEAKSEGLQISLDQYPYVAGSTMLGVILPPWAHDGGTNRLVKRLLNSKMRERMKHDIRNGIDGWDNFIQFAGTEGIIITSVASKKNQDVIGLNLDQLGELRKKDALDATFDLLAEENNAVGMVDFYGKEEHVSRIMKRDEMNVCTDGLLAGKPHPRVYGSFPRILSKYVRDKSILSLEEAIYKMTKKAANAMNIKNRGQIKEGYYADIVLFQPDTIKDMGTFVDPIQYPIGIEYVIVNGEITIHKGIHTKARAGVVIKREGC